MGAATISAQIIGFCVVWVTVPHYSKVEGKFHKAKQKGLI